MRQLLHGIGTPAPKPFEPDPFQLEALAALESDDVLVTAPTGSGKTWIAREETRRLLKEGKRTWYTSPLKALTNSKYHEFCDEFGSDKVGILTGDRKENHDAPIIVGTTEVYRNQLFDALRRGHQLKTDFVVLDEAHYLSDEERGHVWEESIILTPPRIRLLLLSATVGRADEFASWIEEVRSTRVRVISRAGSRPVPLRAAFLHPDGILDPLFDEHGKFNHEIARSIQNAKNERQSYGGRPGHRSQRQAGMPEIFPPLLLASIKSYNLHPAIVFLPTRRRCDDAVAEAASAGSGKGSDEVRRAARQEILRDLAEQFPEMRKHRHWDFAVKAGVASHHAGHLPAWKLAVERMMSNGLLDAIFATTTVAAGVDFPARTVVLENIDMRTRDGWRLLSASELQQMTGRAGRRGRDRVGFIVAAPGRHQDPMKLATLLRAQADPLESQFRATYTTLLNLLDAYGTFAQVREIAERSFARRQSSAEVARFQGEVDRAEQIIREKLLATGCDVPSAVVRGLERLASARSRLLEGVPYTRADVWMRWLDEQVIPGRVVGVGRASRRLVLVTERRGDGFAGIREDGKRASLALERVGRIYATVFPLDERRRETAFEAVRQGKTPPLNEPRLRDARAPSDEAIALINDVIDRVTEGLDSGHCREALWSVLKEAETIERMQQRIESLQSEVWRPFEQRARVLHHFGYINFQGEAVTERGKWLADLRLDRPLLVGETIERGLFARLDPIRAAGLMAALAADAERDFGELELGDNLITTLTQFDRIAYEVSTVEWQQQLEPAPEINFSAAATAARWAAGESWTSLVRETRAEEGDLFRMFSRTGESLLQVTGLKGPHAEAARIARSAADAILREPVRSEGAI